ncbi:GMC family oxidoreductase [Aggregatilineales bacterium SYSU G02658]
MAFLTETERRALRAIAQTLTAPANGDLPQPLAAFDPVSTTALLDELEQGLEFATDEAAKRELKLLLNAFEQGWFQRLFGAAGRPFSQMSQAEREAVLRSWGFSGLALRRKVFQAFKRLTLFIAYGNPPQGAHPVWSVIHYPGALNHAGGSARPTLKTTDITGETTLTADVLVIGSGAGGGVAAAELAAAGFDVLIVEKGDYYPDAELTGDEVKSTQTLFDKRGALSTKDTTMMILAGSTLGGGTTVNWSGSLRTPENVLQEWARDYGFEGAVTPEYQASMDAVSRRVNVNTDECALNPNTALLVKGAEALSYPVEVIPRNVKGCEDCGYCGYGCSFGAKQGTLRTFLPDAVAHGARIVVRAEVRHITHEHGTATGAVLDVTDRQGSTHRVTVKAKAVVMAAGTINTPAILRRSGLTHHNIGAHVHLHPTTVIFSIFDEPVRTWQGASLTRVVKSFNNQDGKGYGVVIETAPAHPGLTAAVMPWRSAADHKRLVAQMEHVGNLIIINRDFHGGRVSIDRHGQPVVEYQLHPYDRAHLQKGVLEAIKIHHAAGARQIFSPHNDATSYQAGNGRLEDFLQRVEAKGLKPNDFALLCAHQMSSCRIAASPQLGATRPDGQLWELKNCFVVDGSALPTATGVNPMLSILTLAHYLSQGVKEMI